MASLVVLGSLVLDRIYRVPRLPRDGESVIADSYAEFLGGKGLNQAFAAKRAGGSPHFIGCLGEDTPGRSFLVAIEEEGLETSGVQVSSSSPTGSAAVWVDGHGMNAIAVHAGANQKLSPEFVLARARGAEIILTQLEIPLECILVVAGIGRLILNPAPACVLPATVLAQVWLLTPNETETEALTGIMPSGASSCRAAAEALLSLGVRHVVLTLGAQGCYYLGGDGERSCPAPVVAAVDSTGAGDVFNGYLAAEIARGASIPDALPIAIAAASLSVTRPGAIPSIPFRGEVEGWVS